MVGTWRLSWGKLMESKAREIYPVDHRNSGDYPPHSIFYMGQIENVQQNEFPPRYRSPANWRIARITFPRLVFFFADLTCRPGWLSVFVLGNRISLHSQASLTLMAKVRGWYGTWIILGTVMTISFQCPHCSKQHQVKAELAGKRARCSCGNQVKIPSPSRQVGANTVSQVGAAPAIAVTCSNCGAVHQADASMSGSQGQCPCGAVVTIPDSNATGATAAGNVGSEETARSTDDDFALAPVAGSLDTSTARSDEDVLREFADREPTLEQKQARIQEMVAAKKMAAVADDDDESLEESLISVGAAGGAVIMLVAAGWFLLGLKGGVFFFYPPILFVLGLIAFISGLNDLL